MNELNTNGYQIENDEYFMQNDEEEIKPQNKKLRKLIKKNKKSSLNEENLIGLEDKNLKAFDEGNERDFDDENIKNQNNNSESGNDIENQFEKSLYIQRNVNKEDDEQLQQKTKPITYKSKLDELSAQVAQMDAEKEAKNKRKSTKKKNQKENQELVQLDDKDEEKQIFEQSEKKQRGKRVKEKKEVEKNEDMVKRLAEKFNDEEEDNEDNKGFINDDIGDEDYEMNSENKKKKKNKKDSNTNKNPNIIKTNNKFFKEIDLLEKNDLDNIEEYPGEEDQEINEESIKLERLNNKNQKNLQGFFMKSMLYKKQRGIDFDNPLTNQQNNCISQENQIPITQFLQIDINHLEEDKKKLNDLMNCQIQGQNDTTNEFFKSSLQIQNYQELNLNNEMRQSNQENQNYVDFSNIQKQISSSSNATLSSQDKKSQLFKQSSLSIQKILSLSQRCSLTQTSSSSQYQSRINSNNDDDLDIELHVPTVDQSQKNQQLINNTLFFNKIIRTGNQNLFAPTKQANTQSTTVNGSSNLKNNVQSSVPVNNKQLSRQEYIRLGQQRIKERKSKNINLSEIQNIFKQTTFDHISNNKNKKSQKESKDSNKITSSQNDKEENPHNINASTNNDDNDSQNTENDSDYDHDKKSDDEDEANQEEQQDEDEEKQKQLIEAEIQYRKLLALEEGISEQDFEKQIRLEYGLQAEEQEDDEDNSEIEQNEDDDENKQENKDQEEENNQKQDFSQEDLGKYLEDYEDEQDKLKKNGFDMIEEDEKKKFQTFKKCSS